MKARPLFIMLAIAFVVQTGHHAEHVTQLIQIYALSYAPPAAHGLLGSAFDFEWVHFIYNFGLELTLIALWLGYRSLRQSDPSAASRLGLGVLAGLMLFQGYHSIEHVFKLFQYLFVPLFQSGATPTPGLLPSLTGWPIFLVHFWFNMVVWAALALAMWSLRPPELLRTPRNEMGQMAA
jgi:hypothetical protein